MTGTALLPIALGLLSAVTLAAANTAIKMGVDILIGRAVLSLSAAALVLPGAVVVGPPDAATAWALAIALPAHFAYQLCLVQAVGRGDLSLVFPVMRGAAPLLTALVVTVALDERLGWLAWVGLLIASAAVLLFAWPPAGPGGGAGFRRHPDAHALGWALATAVAIACYNAADTHGVRAAPTPFAFIVWLFLLDPIGIAVTALATRRGEVLSVARFHWRTGVAAGALSVVSFGSALYAFSLMETAKVSALRETAVVFAALMGATLLKEPFGRRRTQAAVLLTGGLVLMQFG